MAAVIMAMKHHRDQEKEAEEAAQKGHELDRGEIDKDHDGKVSVDEMDEFLDMVTIRADLMLQRLHLEMKMTTMIMKMPVFCTCIICFLVALLQFSPAASVSKVHKHLETHYELSKAKGLKTFEGVYNYIEVFEHHNEELQATSAKFWCEQRYYKYSWHPDYLIPHATCQSPRLHALTLGTAASQASWSSLNPGYSSSHGSGQSSGHSSSHSSSSSSSSSSSHSSSHSSSSSHSRRLRGLEQESDFEQEASFEQESGFEEESAFEQESALKRELAGGSSSGSSGLGTTADGRQILGYLINGTKVINPYPVCEDNDTLLALEEGIPTATCANQAPHICEVDLGITICPKTCNYCAPFVYERTAKFRKPQLTMLPVVIFQTRFPLTECHGFGEIYQKQPVNPVLSLLPSLDGTRSDGLIQCIDRSKTFDGPFAVEKECKDGMPPFFCKPCSDSGYDPDKTNLTLYDPPIKMCVQDSPKADFHGVTVYPKVITEPHKDVERMKKLDWLDLQTDTLSVSTVIYTEGLEIFTSLTVEFSIDEAGNINEQHSMVSYRDLHGGAKASFITCLVLCPLAALLGIIRSVYRLMHFKGYAPALEYYEVFSRLLFLIYPLVLLISWSQQIPMSVEYDHLLHAFLDAQGVTASDLYTSMTLYFEVKTHIYKETSWLMSHRIAANIVLYIQFIQLILYFSVHPKMAMLTDTIWKAITNIIHFLALFGVLFVMMAFMAHWQLGEFISAFDTYGNAISAQGRMIFGEFIYASGAERLQGVMMFMYWAYAFTFMLVMWGLLLNFFLAIVVDAFADVKEATSSSEVVGNFFSDVLDVFKSVLDAIKYNFPNKERLFQFFMYVESRGQQKKSNFLDDLMEESGEKEEADDPVPTCLPEELAAVFPENFKVQREMAVFVTYYFKKMPQLLRRRVGKTRRPSKKQEKVVPMMHKKPMLPEIFWRYISEDGKAIKPRVEPDIDAAQQEVFIEPGTIVKVSREKAGDGGVTYLQLAEGGGWLFDKVPSTGAQICSREVVTYWRYNPENGKPTKPRLKPAIDAEMLEVPIHPGTSLKVIREESGDAGVVFLQLLEGGWLFDKKEGAGTMCTKIEAADATKFDHPRPPKEPRDPISAPDHMPVVLPGSVQDHSNGSALRSAAAPAADGDFRDEIAQMLNMNMQLMKQNQEMEARRAALEEWV